MIQSKPITPPAERERIVREKDFELNGKPWDVTPNDYRAMAADFNPAKYDPEKWCAAAKVAGFTCIVLTARHHDGFAMWLSAFGEFHPKTYENMAVVAEWMKKNGLAVHAVKPLPKGESASVPATALGEVVLALKGQPVKPKGVILLGDGAALDHQFSNGVLTVTIPAARRTKLVDVVRVDR